ncbi:MAG: M1 family peptidase, partial [Bacteroidota bacterium]
ERYLGEDLDWLWTPMLYETWTVNVAVVDVTPNADGVAVTVRDLGLAPVPVPVRLTYADGQTETRVIPVQTWLDGAVEATVQFSAGEVARVELDPEGYLPDVNPRDNVFEVPSVAGTNGP